MSVLHSFLVPIHREGWRFIGVAAAGAAGLALLSPAAGICGVIITAWCAYFFRDPPRMTPTRRGLIVSPADGLIVAVGPATPPPELAVEGSSFTRVSIFMSIFDVHINRAPVDGRIVRTAYRPGRFVSAATDKSSDDNERRSFLIAADDGMAIVVVQIAGLIARRICAWVIDGDAVRTGQRIGMIRFGSRVDVYLPAPVAPLVAAGQRSIAGETVLADVTSTEGSRAAECR
ncbi:MAG: phosphatidylserine decarboxylase [Defluviicoccus sp.]